MKTLYVWFLVTFLTLFAASALAAEPEYHSCEAALVKNQDWILATWGGDADIKVRLFTTDLRNMVGQENVERFVAEALAFLKSRDVKRDYWVAKSLKGQRYRSDKNVYTLPEARLEAWLYEGKTDETQGGHAIIIHEPSITKTDFVDGKLMRTEDLLPN